MKSSKRNKHSAVCMTSYRKLRKQAAGKGSTPGRTKGEHCMASAMDRFFAKYSRARKHPGYVQWCESHRGTK